MCKCKCGAKIDAFGDHVMPLLKEVFTHIRKKLKMDDDRGAVPIVMGFVDDINALVTIEDAAEYLRLFEEIVGTRSNPQHRQNKNLNLYIRH